MTEDQEAAFQEELKRIIDDTVAAWNDACGSPPDQNPEAL